MAYEIWKHKLFQVEQQTLKLHDGAEILSVIVQNSGKETNVVLYEKHEEKHQLSIAHLRDRTILIVGTGHQFEYADNQLTVFVGTVQVGELVFHVFELQTEVELGSAYSY